MGHVQRSSDVSQLSRRPRDPVGAETLAIMRAAPRYHAWQYRVVAPFLGRRMAEIGAGLGSMSEHLLGGRPDLLVLTDMDETYLAALRERFAGESSVRVESLTLPDDSAAASFRELRLDTVVAFNVLEHVEEDAAALQSVAGMLAPGGRVVVLVPALPSLYGTLDSALGHVRRYTPTSLRSVITRAGFTVERVLYFNRLGTLGWWFSSRIRKQTVLSRRHLQAFDACVPLLRFERFVPLPLGQSLLGVGRLHGRSIGPSGQSFR